MESEIDKLSKKSRNSSYYIGNFFGGTRLFHNKYAMHSPSKALSEVNGVIKSKYISSFNKINEHVQENAVEHSSESHAVRYEDKTKTMVQLLKKTASIVNENNSNVGDDDNNNNNVNNSVNNNEDGLISLQLSNELKLKQTLQNHFLFREITSDVFERIFNELVLYQFEQDEILYNENTEGCYFYILAQGIVEAFSNGKKLYLLGPWSCFGESSLISECRREETIKCRTEIMVYVLYGEFFRKVIEDMNKAKLQERIEVISSINLFKSVETGYKHKLAEELSSQRFNKGDIIVNKDLILNAIYVVFNGEISVDEVNGDKKVTKKYTLYGEPSIFFENKFSLKDDIIATSDETVVYILTRKTIIRVFGEDGIKNIILFSHINDVLEKDVFFQGILYSSLVYELIDLMELKLYDDNSYIENKYKKLIIVIEGNIVNNSTQDKYQGNILGSDYLKELIFNEHLDSRSSHIKDDKSKTYTAQPFLVCLEKELQTVYEFLLKKEKIIQCRSKTFKMRTVSENESSIPPQFLTVQTKALLSINKVDSAQIVHKTLITSHTFQLDNVPPTITTENTDNQSLNIECTPLQKISLYHRILKLKQIYLFKDTPDTKLSEIAMCLHKKTFNKDEIIIQENTKGEYFYLISKGKVIVYLQNHPIREMDEGNCFGEIALISDNQKRTATVIALDTVICYTLHKDKFDDFIDDDTIRMYLRNKVALRNTQMLLKDLYVIKFIGNGKYGNVHLVHDQHNYYAIKAICRKPADEHPLLAKYYCRERQIMMKLDHPFIVQMVRTFKNNYFCFFLLEYVNGLNFDEFLQKRKIIKNVNSCIFYISSLFVILDYIHKKQIIHRDIKPSNLVMNSDGYLKLIDFGAAKILNDYSYSIVGTPYYISPEVLSGKEYNVSCDYWSAGICLYEMMYGMYPFGNYCRSIVEVYKEIKENKVIFPVEKDHSKYKLINKLIMELLEKQPLARPCSFKMLKNHQLFSGFQWGKLLNLKLKPPYIPKKFEWNNYNDLSTKYENTINKTLSENDLNVYGDKHLRRDWAEEF